MNMKLSTHEASQFFEQAYEENALNMVLVDKHTHAILSANKQALIFYGYTLDEIQSLYFTDLCVTDIDDDPELERGLDGDLALFSITQRTNAGILKYMEIHASTTSLQNAEQLLLICIDATERQQHEKHLRDNESRHRIIANFNHDWEYWITADGLIGYMSPSCERITGYTVDEYTQNPNLINDIIHPSDMNQWQEHLSTRTEEIVTNTEFRIQHRDGQIVWIDHVSQIIIDEHGNYLGHRASNRDITQRKKIEQQLEQNNEILELAVESAGMAMWTWDIANNHLEYDENWAGLLGYSFEDIQPMNNIWERLVHPQDKQRSVEQMNKVLSGQIPRLEIEQRLQNSDGDWRWFMSRGTVIERANDGTPVRFIGLDIDITERKKNEQDAFQFELERQRIDVLASFMQSARHEFKTPLSRINTKVYLMKRADDAEKREAIGDEIEAQVAEINHLVDSMMLMARLDTISTIPNSPVDLRDILNTLINEFEHEIKARQLHFVAEIPTQVRRLRGNTNDLYEAFFRIIDNAVRYTPTGGHITLTLKLTTSHIIIEVKDTGTGISEENQQHIFERFFREDKAHNTSGIGLGLPIAKRIIEQHHGHIRVASQLDIGTTVQIQLPIRSD